MSSESRLRDLFIRGNNIDTDDGDDASSFVYDVKEELDNFSTDWDIGEETQTYLDDVKKNLDEYTNHLEFDAAHVAGYCVEIVSGLLGMLFSGFKLMFENMKPTRRSTECYSNNSWNYDYSNDNSYDNQKSKKKEKVKDKEFGKNRNKIKIKTDTDKDRFSEKNNREQRDAEKLHRQLFTQQINKTRNRQEEYNKGVRERAKEQAAYESSANEKSFGMAMSKY